MQLLAEQLPQLEPLELIIPDEVLHLNEENNFLVFFFRHLGHSISLKEKFGLHNFSNLYPQDRQENSKIGINHPPLSSSITFFIIFFFQCQDGAIQKESTYTISRNRKI